VAEAAPGIPRRMAAAVRRGARALMQIGAVRRTVLTAGGVPFDPLGPAFREDPYPFYERLRRRGPVYFARMGCWLVTGHPEAVAALRDSRLGHPDYGAVLLGEPRPTALDRFQSHVLLSHNPPAHTRLRRAVNAVLTPAVMEGVRPRVQAVVDRLLDRVQDHRRMDVIEDLAGPLTVGTIASLLGLPDEDLGVLRDRARSFAIAAFHFAPSRAQLEQGNAATAWLGDYFARLVAERRRTARADFLTALAGAQAGGALDEDELIINSILLFSAGFETTIGLIGNGVLALLRDPGALARLREDSSLVPTAVEEFLRYDPAIQYVGRIALDDVRIGEQTIRRGQQVYVMIGAANRDPSRFPDPHRLDITRRDNRHLAFSGGIHACPGYHLARVEAQVAIATLVRRLPDMALGNEGPVWHESNLRALRALPIAF
jgi:cytochrome P450